MSIESAWSVVEAVERADGFAAFGVHRANNFVGKCEFDVSLDVGLRGDRVSGADQPYWYTSVEEIVTNLRVLRETSHPVRPDGKRSTRRIGNARLHVYDVVEERQNVEEMPLGLSHEDDDIAEGEWVVEEQHDIVLQGFDHPADDVLLVATCILPFLVTVRRNPIQGSEADRFVLLQLPDLKGGMAKRLKVIERGPIPRP